MESFHVKINEAKWKSVHKRDKKQQQQQQNQTKTGRLFWRRWGMHITTATETAVVDLIPCSAIGLDGKQMVFLSTFNVAICISAFRKVSSLHPPSKLLFECLACTDLGVGFLHQPIYIASFMLHKNAKTCSYIKLASWIVAVTFYGVSLLTLAVISMDILLALTFKLRYRQVVTLRRTQFIIATL